MHQVAPRTGAEEVTLAEDQTEYKPLVAARYDVQFSPGHEPARALLTRWRLTEDERRRIAEGEDIYLACLTFGDPLQPLMMQVGARAPTDWVVAPAEDDVPRVVAGPIPDNGVPAVMSREEWSEALGMLREGPAEVHLCAIALANHALPADDPHKLTPAVVLGLRATAQHPLWPHSAFLFEVADIIASYLPPCHSPKGA